MAECPQCEGCGRIANDGHGTPWIYWERAPQELRAAVLLGKIRPLPCPRCGGKKEVLAAD
jgi:hypothetical protein